MQHFLGFLHAQHKIVGVEEVVDSEQDDMVFLYNRLTHACVLVRYDYDRDESHFKDDYTIDPGWDGTWGNPCFSPRGLQEVKGLRTEEAAAVTYARLASPDEPREVGIYETCQGEFYLAGSRLEAARALERQHAGSGHPRDLCRAAYLVNRRHDLKGGWRYRPHGPLPNMMDLRALYTEKGARLLGAYRFVLWADRNRT
jgi:hypothetical protein